MAADADPVKKPLIPPDGGWGWWIVVAYAIAHLIAIPMMQSFGLIFKDKFEEMNLAARDISVIINVNAAFGMSLGLVNGPLLRTFGYRKVAFVAGILFAVGIMLTSYGDTFTHFIITYGIIASAGLGFLTASFSLALNSYFKVQRNKAAGIAMTLTGLGPIFFPHAASGLLKAFGVQEAVLIIGAYAMNILVAALLLQPIKWHMKPAPIIDNQHGDKFSVAEKQALVNVDIETENVGDSRISVYSNKLRSARDSRWELSSDEEDDYLDGGRNFLVSLNHDIDARAIYGLETEPPVYRRRPSGIERRYSEGVKDSEEKRKQNCTVMSELQTDMSQSVPVTPTTPTMKVLPKRRWFETGSAETVNLGSSVGIFDERPSEPMEFLKTSRSPSKVMRLGEEVLLNNHLKKMGSLGHLNRIASTQKTERSASIADGGGNDSTTKSLRAPLAVAEKHYDANQKKVRPKYGRTFGKRIVKFLDLDLLCDKHYISLMLGMSIAVFAEINFSLLTPFILNDLHYTTEEIAAIMSAIGTTDIIFRFLSPFVGDHFKQPPKTMYMFSLVLLIITRSTIQFATSFWGMICVGLGLGIAKGVRSVYMGLVIPSYVPIERLASAAGIQMMTNAIFLVCLGPLIGVIRDISGTYSTCIILINSLTFVTLLMWSIEMYVVRRRAKTNQNDMAIR